MDNDLVARGRSVQSVSSQLVVVAQCITPNTMCFHPDYTSFAQSIVIFPSETMTIKVGVAINKILYKGRRADVFSMSSLTTDDGDPITTILPALLLQTPFLQI